MKLQQENINIEHFMEALEEMIDSRDDMWFEQKYCNTNRFLQIKEKRYYPAKEKVRGYLEKILETSSKNNA